MIFKLIRWLVLSWFPCLLPFFWGGKAAIERVAFISSFCFFLTDRADSIPEIILHTLVTVFDERSISRSTVVFSGCPCARSFRLRWHGSKEVSHLRSKGCRVLAARIYLVINKHLPLVKSGSRCTHL